MDCLAIGLRRNRGTAVAVVLAAVLAGGQLALAGGQQQREEDALPRFSGEISVDVATLNVVVTDRDGNPISDLEPDDFEVRVDGEEMPLTHFVAVRGVDAAGGTATPEDGSGAARAHEGEAPARNLVIYLDWPFLGRSSFLHVRPELQRFVREDIPAGTRVMLAGCGRQVEVMVPFTTDRQAVVDGLAEPVRSVDSGRFSTWAARSLDTAVAQHAWQVPTLDPLFATGQPGPGGEEQVPGGGATLGAGEVREMLQESWESMENELGMRTRRSWRALQSLVDSLVGLPGQNVIVHVSDGVPKPTGYQRPPAYLMGGKLEVSRLQQFASGTLPRELRELIDHANTVGVTVHTVYARGADPRRGGSAAVFGRQANAIDSIQSLANGTGGLTVHNVNDETLPALATDVQAFYSLGYRRPLGLDEGRHDIDVKVRRRGARVRHRSSYMAVDERTLVSARTYAALLMEGTANPLGISLAVIGPAREQDGLFQVPLGIRVPARKLALEPDDDTWNGRIAVFLAAITDDGRVAPLQEQKTDVSLSLPEDQAAWPALVVPVQLSLPAGLNVISSSLLDTTSGVGSTVRAELVIDSDGGLWRPDWDAH